MAPLTGWSDRVRELFLRSGMSLRPFGRTLGTSHHAVRVWIDEYKDPRLALAVQVSLLSGYTLDHLTGSDPLLYRFDFAPSTLVDGLASWRRIVWRERMLELVPEAKTRRDAIVAVADRSLLPIRTVSGWVYNMRQPQLACAREVAVGFGVQLHGLALGPTIGGVP